MPKRKTIDEIREFLSLNNYNLHSSFYKNCKTKIEVSCLKGHKRVTSYDSIRRNLFCKECFAEGQLDKAKKIAQKNGGICLSNKYIKNHGKLKWQCSQNHTWMGRYSDVLQSQSWCPYCSSGLYERFCRNSLEFIFNCRFPKKRPDWLLNKNNKKLELDGFNENLKIAFEHNGRYHYDPNVFFNNDKSFKKINEHDNIKKTLCKSYNVKLIIIPELVRLLPLKDLKCHLLNEFNRLDIDIPSKYHDYDIFKIKLHSSKIEDLQKIAKERGGELLSKTYLGCDEKLEWQCEYGHVWVATPAQVKYGTWCPDCYNNIRGESLIKDNHKRVRDIVNTKNGNIIQFFGRKIESKVELQCKKKHRWTTKIVSIIHGDHWCSVCASLNRKTKLQ